MVVLYPNQRGCHQDEDWTTDRSNIFHLIYQFEEMTEDQVPHCTPFLFRKLMLLAFKSVRHTTNLDHLPSRCRSMKNQVPDLQTEFQKVIPPKIQPLCRHWPAFLRQADPKDDRVRSALLDMLPALRHWVPAMGIMVVFDDACRGLLELERWLVCRLNSGDIKFLTFKLLSSRDQMRLSERKSLQSMPCTVL